MKLKQHEPTLRTVVVQRFKHGRIDVKNPEHLGNFLLGWYAAEKWTRNRSLITNLSRLFSYSGIAYRAPSKRGTFCPTSWSKDLNALKNFLGSDVTKGLIIKARLVNALDLASMAKWVIEQTHSNESDIHSILDVKEVVCITVPNHVETVQQGLPYAELQ